MNYMEVEDGGNWPPQIPMQRGVNEPEVARLAKEFIIELLQANLGLSSSDTVEAAWEMAEDHMRRVEALPK